MRIGIDARELTGAPTGVGAYLDHLLSEWAQMPSARAHEWMLYARGEWVGPQPGQRGSAVRPSASRPILRAVGASGRDRYTGLSPWWRPLPGGGGTVWEQGRLAAAVRRDRPDVFFAPGYTAPLAVRTPIALTIHDVSFFAHPEWFSRREGVRRRLLTRWSARKAHAVLTVSLFSKREIVAWTHVDPQRVRVVYPGIPRSGAGAASPRRPVVLYVGSVFNRRRVPDLVRAFAGLGADVPETRLEIVGDNRTHPREDLGRLAESLGVGSRVGIRSYVNDEELHALYSQASVFAFLSEYEGFGFTPLEALAHGVPVVVLDTPVAREIYQDAADYVRPGDIAGTTAALRRLLVDAGERDRRREAAARVLPRYCWRTAAEQTLSLLTC